VVQITPIALKSTAHIIDTCTSTRTNLVLLVDEYPHWLAERHANEILDSV
jgi:hypothetical protein